MLLQVLLCSSILHLVKVEALQSPALSVSEAVSGYSDFIENQSLGGGSSSIGSGMVGGTKSNAKITGATYENCLYGLISCIILGILFTQI